MKIRVRCASTWVIGVLASLGAMMLATGLSSAPSVSAQDASFRTLGRFGNRVADAIVAHVRREVDSSFYGPDASFDMRATESAVLRRLDDVENPEVLFTAIELEAIGGAEVYMRSQAIIFPDRRVLYSSAQIRFRQVTVEPTASLEEASPELSRSIFDTINALKTSGCPVPWTTEERIQSLPISNAMRASLLSTEEERQRACGDANRFQGSWNYRVDDVTVVVRAGDRLIGFKSQFRTQGSQLYLQPISVRELGAVAEPEPAEGAAPTE